MVRYLRKVIRRPNGRAQDAEKAAFEEAVQPGPSGLARQDRSPRSEMKFCEKQMQAGVYLGDEGCGLEGGKGPGGGGGHRCIRPVRSDLLHCCPARIHKQAEPATQVHGGRGEG